MVVEHMAVFYDTVREPGPKTMTGEYASAVTRRFFDFRSPMAAYARIPRSYVILQRINLGLFALLGDMSATADWRRIAEEIWPFVKAVPSTPIRMTEVAWPAGKTPIPDRLGRCHRDSRELLTTRRGANAASRLVRVVTTAAWRVCLVHLPDHCRGSMPAASSSPIDPGVHEGSHLCRRGLEVPGPADCVRTEGDAP